jgi:hypothetical protein
MMGTLIGAASPPLAATFIQSHGGDAFNGTLVQLQRGVDENGTFILSDIQANALAYNKAMDYAFFFVSLLFATCYLCAMYPLISTIKEREKALHEEIVPLLPSIHRCFQNPPFVLLLLCWFVDYMGWYALSAVITLVDVHPC